MAEHLLRPRTSTELVDLGFQIYRRHFKQLLTLSALINIPLIALSLLLTLVFGDLQRVAAITPPTAEGERLVLITLGLSTVYVLVYVVVDAALIVASSDVYLHGTVDVRTALARVGKRFGSLAAASIARGLIIGIGTLLFFVPGILWYASSFAVPATVVLEDRSAGDGLRRSWALARGERGRILSALGLVWFLAFVLLAVGSALPGLILAQAASGVASIIVYPLIAIVTTCLYYDVRIRKEGFDIELMAGTMGPLGEVAP